MWAGCLDYRDIMLGDVLVERLVWDRDAPSKRIGQVAISGPGFIWFRFWLPDQKQIVEKYFDATGAWVGTQVDLCAPFQPQRVGWAAKDLFLDLWISPSGRVTVRNEDVFDGAVTGGMLSEAESGLAERHIRELTAAIAKRRFPPALVRNWQVDLQVLRETLNGDGPPSTGR